MRRTRRSPVAMLVSILSLSLIVAPVSGAQAPPEPPEPTATAALTAGQVKLAAVEGGFSSPIGVTHAGDGTNRLFVVEQRGTVRVVVDGAVLPGFFLDIRGSGNPEGLTCCGERGLLGLAFHPSFETNEKLFVYFTNGGGDLVIAQMTANPTRTAASLASLDTILRIEHSSQGNHNGGQLLFGPDGFLYVFTGDGGGGGDPDENAQDGNSLLGKVLRIAPDLSDGDASYTSPASNPFAGAGEPERNEIWALGMRNPWRASFDRATGDMWIADVGQGTWEEINRDTDGSGGRNYGWDRCEGDHVFEGPGPCNVDGAITSPIAEYNHSGGNCSVTGGFVYRGAVFEDLQHHYVLGDYCSGRIWTLPSGAGSPALTQHVNTAALISSFGESESGELYMTDHNGTLYRVVAPPFNDVTNSQFIDDISWIFYEGITTGCNTRLYCPKASVTREQMASFLARALNLPPSSTDHFTDDELSVHEASINRVADAGITTGCAPGRYCPKSKVTRDQMATFLANALNLPATGTDFFTDDEASGHESNINRIAAAGITTGCGGSNYCPYASLTREQMAAFLHRAFD
jgi:glucose/arabinose dehydrogenase